MGIGPWELILILLIVVLVFGAKRIPEIMGEVGKGIRSFKKSMDTDEAPAETSATAPEAAAKTLPESTGVEKNAPGQSAEKKSEDAGRTGVS
jgi:sec-independent protein translocase protein TatA